MDVGVVAVVGLSEVGYWSMGGIIIRESLFKCFIGRINDRIDREDEIDINSSSLIK
jgi:hypothetical protein